MTLEKKNFRADARVLHEKASGGELGRKKKKRVFFESFFRFSKKGTAVESIEIAPSWSSIKKSIFIQIVQKRDCSGKH